MSILDLIFTIAIVAVLAILFVTTIGHQRRGPHPRTYCLNNIRQIILACHNYQSSHLKFPPGSAPAANVNVGPSFLVMLLPYLDQQHLDDQFRDGRKSTEMNGLLSQLSGTSVDLFWCGSASRERDRREGRALGEQGFVSHYYASLGPNRDPDRIGYQFANSRGSSAAAAIGLNGIFSPWSNDPADPTIPARFDREHGRSFDDVRDGSSNTIAIVESSRSEDPTARLFNSRRGWAFGHAASSESTEIEYVYSGNSISNTINPGPMVPDWNTRPVSSNHPGGANIAMVDGSAKFVSEKVSIEVLRAGSGINDNQFDSLE